MRRKEIAQETVKIIDQGYYEYQGNMVSIRAAQDHSEARSVLITPDEGAVLVRQSREQLAGFNPARQQHEQEVAPRATVEAILNMSAAGLHNVGVLNFASAKNPGGGILNGAMAQEESLAASSGLYGTQLRNKAYYESCL